MEKKGKEDEIKGSSHWWRKSPSPVVAFHYRRGANLTHHSITARPGESMLDMRQEQGALPATTSKQSHSQAAQSRDTLRRRRSLSKHPRLSSGGCSWEGTVTFLIQPAAPFHSAVMYVSQHVHLHLRTQFKITLLNNVNDSPPPDLFSFGIRNQHWGGGVCGYCTATTPREGLCHHRWQFRPNTGIFFVGPKASAWRTWLAIAAITQDKSTSQRVSLGTMTVASTSLQSSSGQRTLLTQPRCKQFESK